MAQLSLADYPGRYPLTNELHARPFPELTPPCRALSIAIKEPKRAAERDRSGDFAHLAALLERYGAVHPAPGANHYSGELGRAFLKWEQHTEFVTYTLFLPGVSERPFAADSFDIFPRDWLAEAPGKVVSSSMVRVMVVEPEERHAVIARDFDHWFVPESLAASLVADGDAVVAGDFRIDENGHSRFAVLAKPGISPRRLGRIVTRLLEVETYKNMALLTLPQAREVAVAAARLDRDLSEIVARMANEPGHEAETLHQLLAMAAEVEALSSSSAFRFGAAGAYEAIVDQRVQILREQRIAGLQLFGEFMMRRFDPAMRTCRSAQLRLAELSARAERAGNLLRTRIDVETQAQNVEVLRAMNQRAAMQLRLQETVEGLSVVAISYYAVSLTAGLLAPLAGAIGLDKAYLAAILTLPVVGGVWYMVRRIRARLGHGSAPAE